MAKKKTDDERIMPKTSKRDLVASGAGRPEELTDAVIEVVTKSLLIGNYFETALASAGFHKDTGYDWLKKGAKNPESIYRKFSDAVRKAEADSESRDVMVIEMAAHGAKAQYDDKGNKVREEVIRDPKMACWRLERKHPKRWGRTEKLEHTGKDGAALSFMDLVKQLEKDAEKE